MEGELVFTVSETDVNVPDSPAHSFSGTEPIEANPDQEVLQVSPECNKMESLATTQNSPERPEPADENASRVKVCVRIRPFINREQNFSHIKCFDADKPNKMITANSSKSFVFDHIFDIESQQEQLYTVCASPLIDSCLKGYNATIMAYGQTGSGKTYTMG